jgi:transcriptional regulator with GAF, ATPase, and Fis domain
LSATEKAEIGTSVASITLQRLLTRDGEGAVLLAALLAALPTPTALYDPDGTLLAGSPMHAQVRTVTLHNDEQPLGHLIGDAGLDAVAGLVAYMLERAREKKSLASEALDKYRELTLLYAVSETINASLDLTATANAVLGEARRRVTRGGGLVLLRDEPPDELHLVAASDGQPLTALRLAVGEGLIGAIVAQARAEIVNDTQADGRITTHERAFRSLIGVPLLARQQVIGALVVGSAEPVAYSAADLKFLQALASLAAPAIDNALRYAQTVRAAEERERRLQQQINALRIEVDQAQQAQQVAAITGTEYFKALRERAQHLRNELGGQA